MNKRLKYEMRRIKRSELSSQSLRKCRDAEAEVFAAKLAWGDESCELLCGLAPEVKEKVLRLFAPRDARHDVNPCFQSLARSEKATEAKSSGKGSQGNSAETICAARRER